MSTSNWIKVLEIIDSQDNASADFNTYLRPLQARETESELLLFAPNSFVKNTVEKKYLPLIKKTLTGITARDDIVCKIQLGSAKERPATQPTEDSGATSVVVSRETTFAESPLNQDYTFENFVAGSSNDIARAAAFMVGEKPGSYNPLLIYGVSGLGKSHLLHSAGHLILRKNPNARVKYLSSERFVSEMVTALQRNKIEEFKSHFRSLDALLLDDIQFFAKKVRSQEELFHTLNSLLDGNQQIIITSDCHPKEQEGIEERLRSRFCWGLAVGIEPPDLETRVAILIKKAACVDVDLSQDVAFFIAENVQANVRELEGALKKVIANSHFMGVDITVSFAKEALRDLLSVHARFITIDKIQKVVSEYYVVKSAELLGATRKRSVARPRQFAMALAKKLTTKSLPEIGQAFGGRDHTTVLHACRKVNELIRDDLSLKEDFENLERLLSN